jgi:hypothetical protein
MTRDEYEAKVSSLIGNTIVKVVYHELDYFDGEFHFFDDPRFDSLDFGLEMELGTGELYSVTWSQEFIEYGVSLVRGAMNLLSGTSRFLDVTGLGRTRSILGKAIKDVKVFWSWVEWVEVGEKSATRVHYYPQDLLLSFEGRSQIVISALEIREGEGAMGMTDNITIFDDVQMAKKFGCLHKA